MSKEKPIITIFWSWQADSDADVNRNFIGRCLEKAAKIVAKERSIIISVDRDTRGVGGTPAIADTILAKIRCADVFVWDATLISLKPKPSPNPNVLFELGYAFAVLGEGRLVGVMNAAGIPDRTPLPFDLNHRRWPIKYALWPSTCIIAGRRRRKGVPPPQDKSAMQDQLTRDLVAALKAALKEPKGHVLRADVDLQAAKSLWKSVDSAYLRNWYEMQTNSPQWETHENVDKFGFYLRVAEQPENHFQNEELGSLHNEFLDSICRYLGTSAVERVPDPIGRKKYVISTKACHDFVEDYDERYDKQINALTDAAERVWSTWKAYVDALRALYPEITSSDETA